MAAILDSKMAAKDKNIVSVPIVFVDLKNICLDTKIMFL